MSAQIQPAPDPTTTTNPDAAYQWYLENHDEIMAMSDQIDFLTCLQQIEQQMNLPAGTAERFATLHTETNNVPEAEEMRYLTTWDAYHQALDEDATLAAIARTYGERALLPISDRINAEGTFIF